jgi:hypothetical protein
MRDEGVVVGVAREYGDRACHPLPMFRPAAPRCETGRQGFERDTHLVEPLQVGNADFGDKHAATGRMVTSFSSARRFSASRIGVRPTSSSSCSAVSSMTEPGGSSSVTILRLISHSALAE